MNTRELKTAVTNKPVVKFFNSTESMRRYLNYRYGYDNATKIYNEPRYVRETAWGNLRAYGSMYFFQTKNGKWGFEQSKADEHFPLREVAATKPAEDYDDMAGVRRMETMAAYIHSGAGLDNYYSDLEAGYID